jgi:hypothetical protein
VASTWAWGSVESSGSTRSGTLFLVAFVFVERRAVEPVLPLRLFRSRIFTLSNVASFGISMVMFGAIIYIPVYAQGVIGVGATDSGLILMPLMVGLMVIGILTGHAHHPHRPLPALHAPRRRDHGRGHTPC